MIRTLFSRQYHHAQSTPRKREAWDIARPIIFGVGLLFALIPSFYPITNHEFVILPMMAVVIFITHLALTLRTLSVAASIQTWGKGAEAWDVLAMTGISARQFIWKTQREIMRRVWFDHVVFSLLRLGLAVGIAELLNMILGGTLHKSGLAAFFYYSRVSGVDGIIVQLAPEATKIFFTGIVLAGFAVAEAGLLAACNLIIMMWNIKSSPVSRIGASFLTRALLVCMVVGIWTFMNSIRDGISGEIYCQSGSFCSRYIAYDDQGHRDRDQTDNITIGRIKADFGELLIPFDIAMISLSTLGDNATLLAADMLRPTFGVLSMIRNIPHIVIGAGLYWGLIRLLMWGAVRLAIRRGMLP